MHELLATDTYRLVEGRHGRFLANPQDIYIGRSIIEYGEFSELEWHLLDQIVQPNTVVIEAGANMGAHTIPMAKKLGRHGLLFAFEPQLFIFQQLCANIALNDLVNVQAFNAGCGAEPGWLSIVRPDPTKENNFGGFSLNVLQGETPIQVRIECLDEVVQTQSLHLIKADVEGMEAEVLRGAAGLIKRFRPLLYLEANIDDAPELIEYLFSIDYRGYWHLPRMFNPDNYRGNSQNLFGNITSKNMLCAPREKSFRMQGAREVTGPEDHPNKWTG